MRIRSSLLLLSLLAASAAGPAGAAEERLPARYREWLAREVVWIITPGEREEFLRLAGDAERDAFIERFWRVRDPVPLTPANEFRLEHAQRVKEADRKLGSDATRPGSLTERGRVYILLGKPDDVERTVSSNEIYPYEMWFYGNTGSLGLPGQLRLVFYRPFGVGEYRLLNPVLERDRLFPPSSQIDPDELQVVRSLVGPEVAQALGSVAPGHSGNTSDEIIQELKSPRRIPERILEKGLALHPEVTTRFSLERVELPLVVLPVPLEDGSAAVHLAARLPAEELAFQEVGDGRFAGRVDVFGDVTDANGLVVASFGEAAALELGRAELETRKRNGFAFQAVRSLLPGRYRVDLFLQPFGNGRLGHAHADLVVPAAAPERARIEPLALAFRVDRAAGDEAGAPFVVAGFRLFPRPGDRFGATETVYAFGLLHAPGTEGRDLDVDVVVRRGEAVAFEATAPAPGAVAAGPQRPLLLRIPAGKLDPGTYRLRVAVRDGDRPVAGAEGDLEVAAQTPPPGELVYVERKPVPPEVLHLNRGVQLLARGDLAGAERQLRLALGHRNNFNPARVHLARTLLLGGRAAEAAPLVDKALEKDPDDYDALVTRGSMLLGSGAHAGAAQAFERALEVGPRAREVLNALGEARLGLGDVAAARRWFRESLAVDPSQPVIRRRLDSLPPDSQPTETSP